MKDRKGLLVRHQRENNLSGCLICVLEHSLDPGNGSEFNMVHYIGLNSNRDRVTESVFDETVNIMGRAHKALHPRQLRLYDWEIAFTGAIHCAGKDVFLAQCARLCHHGICNEGHVFVLPRYVKGTTSSQHTSSFFFFFKKIMIFLDFQSIFRRLLW
jgi:hypothetical protein